ncbi:MAG: DUF488 domain-containing protein [Alphaproteobacteria bacterium]|jgi:uncharacterized protein (DUF488 family)|nr:DUF488 domain-containing protein [Alphaproteobacteria bacterium]
MIGQWFCKGFKVLYTIGHSNVELEYFLDVLKKYEINILCDIRITPYSGYVPHFNKESLAAACKKAGIQYIHKTELGSVNVYPLVEPTEIILNILEKMSLVVAEKNVALMSDGWDYKNCHRTILADWMEHHFGVVAIPINIKNAEIFAAKTTQLNIFN